MPEVENRAKIIRLEEKVGYLEKRAEMLEQKQKDLEGLVEVYKASTEQVKNKLDKIYEALIGDDVGNVGVVKRLAAVETVIAWLEKKKSQMWVVVAAVGAVIAFVRWALDMVFKLLQ